MFVIGIQLNNGVKCVRLMPIQKLRNISYNVVSDSIREGRYKNIGKI